MAENSQRKRYRGFSANRKVSATFWIDLSLEKTTAIETYTDISTAAAADTNGIGFDGKKVLLVEDNEVNQMIASHLLMGYNCHVATVVNGAQAVESALNDHYDLILMDCQMPVMDGFEATRQIRIKREQHIPIIALTANAITGDREKYLDAGMDDYLSKPIDPEALKNTLAKWLNAPL